VRHPVKQASFVPDLPIFPLHRVDLAGPHARANKGYTVLPKVNQFCGTRCRSFSYASVAQRLTRRKLPNRARVDGELCFAMVNHYKNKMSNKMQKKIGSPATQVLSI